MASLVLVDSLGLVSNDISVIAVSLKLSPQQPLKEKPFDSFTVFMYHLDLLYNRKIIEISLSTIWDLQDRAHFFVSVS